MLIFCQMAQWQYLWIFSYAKYVIFKLRWQTKYRMNQLETNSRNSSRSTYFSWGFTGFCQPFHCIRPPTLTNWRVSVLSDSVCKSRGLYSEVYFMTTLRAFYDISVICRLELFMELCIVTSFKIWTMHFSPKYIRALHFIRNFLPSPVLTNGWSLLNVVLLR